MCVSSDTWGGIRDGRRMPPPRIKSDQHNRCDMSKTGAHRLLVSKTWNLQVDCVHMDASTSDRPSCAFPHDRHPAVGQPPFFFFLRPSSSAHRPASARSVSSLPPLLPITRAASLSARPFVPDASVSVERLALAGVHRVRTARGLSGLANLKFSPGEGDRQIRSHSGCVGRQHHPLTT